jgi:tRNA-uridine 2-sulfurtransferase
MTMRVLVAMSGGVDSSVAAALLMEQGYDVAGATLKLWRGDSDSGCCSIADVDDARRVAQQLGIDHYVFNLGDDFDTHVVEPYIRAHTEGLTPNPCIECNRHVKFDRLLARAQRLGFDAIATGHHVRREQAVDGSWRLLRAVDRAKDQSYVVHMLDPSVIAQCLFPVGDMEKAEVRTRAAALGLRTADKPDSQDVCFIEATKGGRRVFLGSRIPLRSATVVDTTGAVVGAVDAVELVTIGQRKGLGIGGGPIRYAIDVDPVAGRVVVGDSADLLTDRIELSGFPAFDHDANTESLSVQCSAHGDALPVRSVEPGSVAGHVTVHLVEPHRRIAPGQSVVVYAGETVLAGGQVSKN